MSTPIRWGILGPGSISHKFATGLKDADNGVLTAIGSRNGERAAAFAKQYGAAESHDSYQALVENPNVDAIYIGTPHSFHKEHSILCLTHGKHVLVEKPFAINRAEAEEMVAVAQREKRVLMEAMWSRFLPTISKVRELINAGAIGTPRMVQADFGFRTNVNPDGRLFKKSLGGGALLDVGIYPLTLAHMVFGKASDIATLANLGSTGVDEESAFLLRFDGGGMALLSTAIRLNTPHDATIIGTDGWIKLPAPWWVGSEVRLKAAGKDEQLFDLPFKGNGYTHEAEEVGRLINAGKLESDIVSLSDSLEMMEMMDAIRAQWGLRYPMED